MRGSSMVLNEIFLQSLRLRDLNRSSSADDAKLLVGYCQKLPSVLAPERPCKFDKIFDMDKLGFGPV